ncbi:DegT/DnrJ/EryC1/StrS aminotransferase family protein [Candidatus Parcubacteria bacterium]|nr:MAG: DegT/DnrJ/EryC1/StrS aminotransferase family protein [Candidatus Parcubacteria bacterium]
MKSQASRRRVSAQKPYLTFGAPDIGKEEIGAVTSVLRSSWLGTGPKTHDFEHLVGKYTGAQAACALNSATAALHLSLVGLGIGAGDEVITTPLTFCASANAIIHAGATPVFVDVERDSMNIDPTKIEKAITKKTKAILPVHMAGRPCNMEAIKKLARKHKLFVIEDAAHALGASYKGKKIGSLSDATCFSFYVTKNIITGEGGMITTNDKQFADRVRILSLHGMSKDAWKRYSASGYSHYEVVVPGFKYNLTDLASAIGIEQMKKISRFNARRKKIWDIYSKAFKDLPVVLPAPIPADIEHARHLYTLLIDEKTTGLSRDAFMQALHERGVGSGVHFRPVHLHAYYREHFGYKEGDFPHAEYIGERTVSIPFSSALTDREVSRVIKAVREVIEEHHG